MYFFLIMGVFARRSRAKIRQEAFLVRKKLLQKTCKMKSAVVSVC